MTFFFQRSGMRRLIPGALLSPLSLQRSERFRKHRTVDELELKASPLACITRPPTSGSASMHSAFMRQYSNGDSSDGGGSGIVRLFQYRKRYIDFVGRR
jgi:hypothetical protein